MDRVNFQTSTGCIYFFNVVSSVGLFIEHTYAIVVCLRNLKLYRIYSPCD
ncbi:hypothetical protein GQX74_009173 [Glossina fuscipes]|nr:hypothetical protein GQX74_009173 [Glossina fuscipes]